MFTASVRCLFLLFIVMCTFLSAPAAEAREHRITEVSIEADVRTDGTVHITENRTFAFDGAFSWFEQRISTRGFSAIEDIAVSEDGRAYTLSDSGEPGTFSARHKDDEIVVRLNYQAEDESRTFTVSYVIRDAVASGGTWDEFVWTYIGSGWETKSERVHVRINLPESVSGDNENIYAFHKQRRGPVEIETESSSVDFSMQDLPGGRSLRIHTSFPSGYVENTVSRPDVESPHAILQRIEDEAERLALLTEQSGPLRTVGIALALFSLLFSVFMVIRHGQHTVPAPDLPQQSGRPPKYLEPALVGWLFRNIWSTHEARFTGTIFDLARKGYFKLVQIENKEGNNDKEPSLALERTDKELSPELNNWELNLVKMLESRLKGDRKSLDDIFAGKDKFGASSEFSTWWHKWFADIGKDARSRNWIKDNVRPIFMLVGVQFLLVIAGIMLLIYLSEVTFFPGLLVTLTAGLGTVAAFLLHIRSEEGQKVYLQWRAYRKALAEGTVSAAPEHKAEHIIYAITLGISNKQMEGIIETVKPEDNDISWMVLLPGFTHSPAMFSGAVNSASGSISSIGTSFSTGSSGAMAGTAGGGGGGSVG